MIEIPLLEKVSKLKVSFGKHKRATFKIVGTTYSGSCSRTTLGNTLRVFLYWDFICSEIGLTTIRWHDQLTADVFLYVSGDDAVMWTSPENAKLIE